MHRTIIRIAKFIVAIAIIVTMTMLSSCIALRMVYPNRYFDYINNISAQHSVDVNIVRGIVWTESRFDRNATSRAGAIGLMQLMPATAAWIAQVKDIDKFDMTEPRDNITFGVFYVRYLLDKFGDVRLALVAYNAGEGNLRAWLANDKYANNGTLHTIPFVETRSYVDKVFRASRMYRRLYGG